MADGECFPPGLQRLVQALGSPTTPGVEELPDLSDVREFGPCFNAAAIRSQGQKLKEGGTWSAVRFKVLSLVATCPTLTHVNLANCCIDGEEEMNLLCLGLAENQVLEQLNLSDNAAVGTKTGCELIAKVISSCRKLRTLCIARVGITCEGFKSIAQALKSDVALKHLDVTGNPKLRDDGMALLAAVLEGKGREGLKTLAIGCVGMVGGEHLGQALSGSTVSSLECLKILGDDGVDGEEGQCPLQLLLKSLVHPGPVTEYDHMSSPAVHNESLKILSLKNVKEDGLAEFLARVLLTNTALQELRLEGSNFSKQEWRRIIRSLHDNTTLTSLFLGSCQGLQDSFDDFMELAGENSTLEFIGMPNTEMERSGQNIAIMDALKSGKDESEDDWTRSPEEDVEQLKADLKSLPKGLFDLISQLTSDEPSIKVLPRLSTLNTEEFGDFFTFPHFSRDSKDEIWCRRKRAILHIIACCPTLTHIDLEGCSIHKEEEVQDLCLGLSNSKVLECLNVGGNGGFGTDSGSLNLCRLVVKIPTLRELHLHAVGMKPDLLVYLTAALRTSSGPGLHTLDINFNPGLGDEGAEALATLLTDQENPSTIRNLRMFGTGMGVKGAYEMALGFKKNNSLKSLFMGFETEDENAEGPLSVLVSALIPASQDEGANALHGCSRSVENLGICGARETGLSTVVARLLTTSRIRALTLSCSYFTTDGWQEIFKSLARNSTLEALDMTQCEGLDTAAYDQIMLMLQTNRTLKDILLSQTALERSGRAENIHQQLIRNLEASGAPRSARSHEDATFERGVEDPAGLMPHTASPYHASPHQAVTVSAEEERPSWVPPSTIASPPVHPPPPSAVRATDCPNRSPPRIPNNSFTRGGYNPYPPPPPEAPTDITPAGAAYNPFPPPPPKDPIDTTRAGAAYNPFPHPPPKDPIDTTRAGAAYNPFPPPPPEVPVDITRAGGAYNPFPPAPPVAPIDITRAGAAYNPFPPPPPDSSEDEGLYASGAVYPPPGSYGSTTSAEWVSADIYPTANSGVPYPPVSAQFSEAISGRKEGSAHHVDESEGSSRADSRRESTSAQGGDKKKSSLRAWAREKKEKVKERHPTVYEVTKAGKDLVKEKSKEQRDRVLNHLSRKLSKESSRKT